MRFFFFVLMMIPALAFSQSWNYSYIDPCTKKVKTLSVNNSQSILVNYYGVVNTFNASDFTNGNFENWIVTTAAINSAKPCDEVTTLLTNNTNSVILSNTINVVSNVMAVTQMASSLGTSMTSTAESINNSSTTSGSGSGSKKENKNGTNSSNSAGSNTNGQGNSTGGNSSQTSGSSGTQGGNSTNTNNATQGGSQTPQSPVNGNGNSQSGNSSQNNSNSNGNGSSTGTGNPQSNGNSTSTGNGTPASGNGGSGSSNGSGSGSGSSSNTGGSGNGSNTGGSGNTNSTGNSGGGNTGTGSSTGTGSGNTNGSSENPTSGEQGSVAKTGGSGSTANSVSNAVDGGGSSGGGSGGSGKGNGAKAQSGSLIASGDVVVIQNTGESREQLRFVGSITKSNTNNRKVTGALFTYTTGINTANITLYKSFVSEHRKYNLVVANSSMLNPEKDFFNTTTALETVKWKKFTFMGGLNYTVGNLGETRFMNLSTVLGAHGGFRVSPRINTSFLMMSIYSPFTQFYDGKWWDAGLLVVPFSSWDFKITKTFKYNISFTGVYEMNNNFLNYQILTGGKINF